MANININLECLAAKKVNCGIRENVEWNNGPIVMMIICSLVVVYGLVFQYFEFKKINDFSKKPNEEKYPVFLFIGMMTVASGAIGFGRPYTPFVVALVSLVGSVIVYFTVPGLMDWFEKTSLLMTLCTTISCRIHCYRLFYHVLGALGITLGLFYRWTTVCFVVTYGYIFFLDQTS